MSASTARITTARLTAERVTTISKNGTHDAVKNDVFEKCRTFTRPADLQAAGLYMYFETFGDREGCGPGEVRRGDSKVLMFGSNDYLDLITHPEVMEAAANAAKHVFRAGQGTGFAVSLTALVDGRLRLMIADDGPGFEQASVVAGAKASRLGMGIMQSLAQQLGGRLGVTGGPGTTLSVDFPRAREEGLLF